MRSFDLARLSALVALSTLVACGTGDDAPPDHVFAQTTSLVPYASCGALEADLEDMLIREIHVNIDRYDPDGYGYGAEDGATGDSPPSGDSGGGRQEGEDYSGTNNQEQGVDEADLVKTDGYSIFALNGNRLHIFGVPEFGMLTPTSVTKIEGHPRELLLDRAANRAVVFSYVYVHQLPEQHPLRALTGWAGDDGGWYYRSSLLSKMTVLDITDRAAPTLVREVFYEGWYQTARKVDATVRVGMYSSIDRPELWDWYRLLDVWGHDKARVKRAMTKRVRALSLAELTPQMYERTPGGAITVHGLNAQACQAFYRPTDSHARGFSSIIAFDLLGAQLKFDADHVVSNWSTFYASQDKIVLAEPSHAWWWYWYFQDDVDQLNVHVFDTATAGRSRYLGSGRVLGHLSDQFAIDEDEGEIRLATTTNLFRWWGGGPNGETTPPEMENHVWLLMPGEDGYQITGHVDGIALGERITAARFLGDKGYIVTFRQIDPLFTIDLSNPHAPALVGELKIPGFSTYLHPLGDDRLLTIGVGGTDEGANGRTTVATFDVGNFAMPALTQALPIEGEQGWGWSEAMSEHKAFQYFAPKQLLAIPQSTYDYGSGYYRYLSKLELINVDAETGALSRKGSIDHSSYYAGSQYWSYLQIRRSIFMGDFIYAISDRAITVHRLSDLGQVTAQTLPGYTADDWYWWW